MPKNKKIEKKGKKAKAELTFLKPMGKTIKPIVGFYSTSGCQGCLLSVIFNEKEFLDLVGAVDLRAFPFIAGNQATWAKEEATKFDVIFHEGLVCCKEDEETVKKLREKTKILVAIGTCACTGNIPAYKKYMKEQDYCNLKHDKIEKLQDTEARPIHQIVKVDLMVPGCPPRAHDATDVVKNLLLNIEKHWTNPVCYECRLKDIYCLLEKNRMCLGPITTGGCDAWCPRNNYECWGCRGLTKDANIESLKHLLKEKGFSEEEILKRMRTFAGTQHEELEKAITQSKAVASPAGKN